MWMKWKAAAKSAVNPERFEGIVLKIFVILRVVDMVVEQFDKLTVTPVETTLFKMSLRQAQCPESLVVELAETTSLELSLRQAQ
jgi:hypothetical protein